MSDPSSVGQMPDLIRLDRPALWVGRATTADVRLPHPAISGWHAELRREGGRILVRDLGSRSGVRVNGVVVASRHLDEDDQVAFGPILYQVKGNHLRRLAQPDGVNLDARDLVFGRGSRTILAGVSLTIPPNNFVGILGSSGAGKTTLLKGLTGYLPALAGQVFYDGLELTAHREACRAMIGYVPQDDVIYASLTARENLDFALRLRVAGDLQPAERAAWVEAGLKRLGLEDHADRPVSKLSGGQRKRVNVAVELLARPRLLFLDEPTSGLDPAAEARLMTFLRDLARRGTTVVCTTHVLENLDLFDAVMVVAGGRLLGSGKPANLLRHFQVQTYAELYEKLENPPPAPARPLSALPRPKALRPATTVHSRAGTLSQIGTQFLRGLRLIGRDRTLVIFLAGQPLLIGLLINLSQIRPSSNLNLFLTFAVVASIWLGLNNTAREVVRDRPIYVRERRSLLNPESYVLAKVLLFGCIGLAQLVVLVLWLRFANVLDPESSRNAVHALSELSLFRFLLVLWLTYMSAMLLGLLISTLSPTEEVAVAVLPLVVLPQLLLSYAAADLRLESAGWFNRLDVLVQRAGEAKPPRGIAGWSLEVASMATYSRPALVFFLEFSGYEQRTVSPFWGGVIDWSHLLLLLLATATAFVAVFRKRERRWLERA